MIGKRATFHAAPWRGKALDACQIRFVAITDPDGKVTSGARPCRLTQTFF